MGTVVFKVVSPEYPSVGNLKYKAELTGAGISPVKGSGPVDADGRTPVAVSTSDLDFGSYTLAVHVVYDGSKNELGLVEGAVSVAQFEVTPVFFAVSFECAGDITEDEIPASTVITALQRGIQRFLMRSRRLRKGCRVRVLEVGGSSDSRIYVLVRGVSRCL